MTMYDQMGRVVEQDDDAPARQYDLDEAQEVLMAARRWIDLDRQPVPDDRHEDGADSTRYFEDKSDALERFCDWLNAYVDARIEKAIGASEQRIAAAVKATIEHHTRNEWHEIGEPRFGSGKGYA